MSETILLEVSVESVDDALAAQRGGADRLELCAALDLGGLTPSYATLTRVAQQVDIPVMVMIRPRGGDFAYSDSEIVVMEEDIDAAAEAGASGLVFGVLGADGSLDIPQMKRLLDRCGDLPAVCHRAFDFVFDPVRALEELIDLGVTRVLTSGQQHDVTSPAGVQMIRTLQERAAGRIEILPGCGIRPHNVAELVRVTGCTQVHGTFRTSGRDMSTRHETGVSSGVRAAKGEGGHGVTDETAVAEVRRILDEFHV